MRPNPALISMVLAAGCSGGLVGARDELKMAVQEFNDGIRWGKVEQCAAHLPADRRLRFAERWAGVEDELEVMDYDVQRIDYDRQADRALVRVDISWSLKRRGLVERTTLEEEWRRQGGWVVVSSRRLKGSPLPVME